MTWQVPNLYALAAYDMLEFIEALAEVDNTVLEELYTTLTFPNAKHSPSTNDLNELASGFVKSRLEDKGLKVLHGETVKKQANSPQDPHYRNKHLSESSIG